MGLSKSGLKNKVLVPTDGYFFFESQAHVIQDKTIYDTRFFKRADFIWKQISESKEYGLLLSNRENTKWIVAGISGKKSRRYFVKPRKSLTFWKK
jgi:hypothetical protein